MGFIPHDDFEWERERAAYERDHSHGLADQLTPEERRALLRKPDPRQEWRLIFALAVVAVALLLLLFLIWVAGRF